MAVSNARLELDQGRLQIVAEWDRYGGGRLLLNTEQLKRTLLARGFVYLGSEWAGRVPPLTLPAVEADNQPAQVLRGFTRDPDVLWLARYLIAQDDRGDDQVQLGPIELPPQQTTRPARLPIPPPAPPDR
jgi:hypothetical protein